MAFLADKSIASNADELAQPEPAKADEGVEVATGKNDSQQSSNSPPPLIRASTTPRLSNPPSTIHSPRLSREASPTRPPLKPGISEGSKGLRSRKNSTDLSPTRPPGAGTSHIPTIPSAAAIQRALSVAGTTQLQPSTASELSVDAPKTQRPSKAPSGGNTHSGSNVVRVKSPPPPPISNKPSFPPLRRTEQTSATPSIILERPTPTATSSTQTEGDEEDIVARPGMRTPNRGISASGSTLETVQESSLPATPAIGPGWAQSGGKGGPDDRPERIDENPMEDGFGKDTQPRPESGSESGGNKNAGAQNGKQGPKRAAMASNSAKPQIMHPKKSATQLHPAKGKTGSESTVQSMTVETETVSSIPQVALGGGAGERSIPGRTDTGSLRLKPSTETIRPKKDKKKVVRKTTSINSGTGGLQFRHFHHHHIHARPPSPTISLSIDSPDFISGRILNYGQTEPTVRASNPKGRLMQSNLRHSPTTPSSPSSATLTILRVRTASSKADIFEAKVASAVDQTNSSDSEETFVYESNPPEPLSARPHRFHSRTPSATSMVSQVDPYGGRTRQEGHHSIASKKSMKFTNNPYNATDPSEEGTVRGPNHSRRATGGNSTHHHVGRHGRGGHTSLFDQESPFPGATKPLRSAANNVVLLNSRPSSPRSPHILRVPGSGKRSKEPMLYDLEGEGADDERTPLIGSARSGRTRIRRPLSGGSRHGYSIEKEHRFCRRVACWISLGSLVALLVAAVVIVLVLCSQPLMDVYVKDIQNVLASEQEIMLDLHVHAINPNLIAVQVSALDINIFARSKHVGTGQLWRDQHPHGLNVLSESLPKPTPDENQRHSERSNPTHHALEDPTYHQTDDPIDDPLPDPETDSQTMLLGRIFEFDSPLIFEPSPLRRNSLSSVGEVRLAKPGNKTEEGGSERWEKVLSYDFELIVRGVMRYSFPLGTKTRSPKIGGSVVVHPGQDVNKMGGMAVSRPKTKYEPGSNVLLDGFRGQKGEMGVKVRFVA